jgi:hypothetical protein
MPASEAADDDLSETIDDDAAPQGSILAPNEGEPGPGLMPPDETTAEWRSAMCVEVLQVYRTQLDEALAVSENLDCASSEDCKEVDECGGSVSCSVGGALNLQAANAFDATRDATCACLNEDPYAHICPEPEPPPPGCAEGVCAMGGGATAEPPQTCAEREASWDRFVLPFRATSVQTGCRVLSVGNGCTGGACQHFPVSEYFHARYQAMIESHLRFNDCTACGPDIACSDVPEVEEVAGRCVLVQ